MVWLAALLLAGVFGLMGMGLHAPIAIALLAAAIVGIDGFAANEFTASSFAVLALVVITTFLVWRISRTVVRPWLSS